MKRRFAWAAFFAICLLLIGLWQGRYHSVPLDSITPRHSATTEPRLNASNGLVVSGGSLGSNGTGAQAPLANIVTQPTNLVGNNSVPKPAVATNDLASRQNQKAKAWVTQQNGKINFWGRVLDQDDHPLSEVTVVMKVRRFRLTPAGADFPEFVAKTDADGRFRFLDATGDTMSIASLTKPGYRLAMEDQRRSMAYQYHNLSVTFVPDPANPEVFHLYKEKGAEPMIHYKLWGKIPVDGTPSDFDLRLGKQIPSGGDLQIAMVRDPMSIKRIPRKNYYGWRLRFSMPGGGIQQRKDHFGFEAPQEGYLESIEFGQAVDDPQWSSDFEGEFYFRTRDGRFGRIQCNIGTDYQPPPCGMLAYGYINPSGSRNLEYDSRNRVMPR